jgi:UDP-N-acetylglucosamine 2-epimerase (non-hydrolysing)
VKVLSIFGTRPEAIKMAPVVKAIAASPYLEGQICVTGQHRDLLDQALDLFSIKPDFDLNLMAPDQTPQQVCVAVMKACEPVLTHIRPDLVLVHGDTTTSMAASLAAFFQKIQVGHVEAGLRTGTIRAPWPEEANRRVTGVLADLHFAPTEGARANLRAENVPDDRIWVTGNTIIDALHEMTQSLSANEDLCNQMALHLGLTTHQRVILVTAHRRETIGDGLDRICAAVRILARRGDCQFVIPVHPNPHVSKRMHDLLGTIASVHLIAPQPYLPFVYLMNRAHIILTDSGGVQEEAPALGTPVLVLRDQSERPEAVDLGTAALVGTDTEKIVTQAANLLDDDREHAARSVKQFPYGGGKAADAILAVLEDYARKSGP